MIYVNPHWLAHQRKRWMRPDADRYWRHDRARFFKPGVLEGKDRLNPLRAATYDDAQREQAFHDDLMALRREHEALRRAFSEVKAELLARKAGFDPSQPRVPAGNADGGQWTSEGGVGSEGSDRSGRDTDVEFGSARRAPGFARTRGHHFVARSVFRDRSLSAEARRIFDNATTGRLRGQLHGWSKGHREYNAAVTEALDEFMASRKITGVEMTAGQALEFVDQVKRSSDERIRQFNLNILRQELRYILRFGPRRPE
jgi:hypothetical protein